MVIHAGSVASLFRGSLESLLQRLDSDRRGADGPGRRDRQPGEKPGARAGGAARPDLHEPARPRGDQRPAADQDRGLERPEGPDAVHDDRTVRPVLRCDRHERRQDRPVRRVRSDRRRGGSEPLGQPVHPRAEHRHPEGGSSAGRDPARHPDGLRARDDGSGPGRTNPEPGMRGIPQGGGTGRRWRASGRLRDAARRKVPVLAVVDGIAAELDRM